MPAAVYTEFFVTQGSGALATNGGGPRLGTNDAAVYTLTGGASTGAKATDNGTDSDLEDMGNGGWSGVIVDDFLCFDTAGAKVYTRVTAINVGSDPDVITVHPMVTAWVSGNYKSVKVGGAWALPSAATVIVNALGTAHAVNAAGSPPRLNVKRHSGTAYIDANIAMTTAFTAACPFTLEGYDSDPGDIDPHTSTNRTIINTTGNSSSSIIALGGAYNRCLNIGGTAAGTTVRNALNIQAAGDNCVVRNVRFCSSIGTGTSGAGCSIVGSATDLVMDRAIFENCTGSGIQVTATPGVNNKLSKIISRNNAENGIMGFGGDIVLEDCLIYGNTGVGLLHVGNVLLKGVIKNCTIADNGSHGIDFGTMDIQTVEIVNCIIADNGGADINSDLTTLGVMFGLFGYNCLHGNASTIADDAYVAIPTAHNITSEPWTQTTQATRKATGVYTTTAAMKNAGAGTMPDSAIADPTSHVDLGYYQGGAWNGTYPAAADVKDTDTAYGPTNTEYAGALSLAAYTLISGVAGADAVIKGHDNYTGGSDGLFDVTNCTAGNIKTGVTIGGTSTHHADGIYTGGGVFVIED